MNRLGPSLIWNSVVVEFSSTTFWKLFERGKVGSSASRPRGFGLSLGSFLSLSPPCLLDVKAFLRSPRMDWGSSTAVSLNMNSVVSQCLHATSL